MINLILTNKNNAVLAQLVEQPPCKRQVVGAEPTHGSIFLFTFSSLCVKIRTNYGKKE